MIKQSLFCTSSPHVEGGETSAPRLQQRCTSPAEKKGQNAKSLFYFYLDVRTSVPPSLDVQSIAFDTNVQRKLLQNITVSLIK